MVPQLNSLQHLEEMTPPTAGRQPQAQLGRPPGHQQASQAGVLQLQRF